VKVVKGKIHEPVLLKEVIELLKIDSGGVYVDCTLGDGSYSLAILEKLRKGRLISLDCDESSIEYVQECYSEKIKRGRWDIVRANFKDLNDVLAEFGIKRVSGIVFDLGLSSRQLDDPLRGFSYKSEAKLDMRMDDRLGVNASDLIRVAGKSQLEKILTSYGEERFAGRISSAIKEWVRDNPESTMKTGNLVKLIRRVVPAGYRKGLKHPARRTFQALRIAVNDELFNLAVGLSSALSMAASGCRIVVISYHSLEDRIVKRSFKEAVENKGFISVSRRLVVPSDNEKKRNPRSRSAKLRVVEKSE